jgi:hypothetical protein
MRNSVKTVTKTPTPRERPEERKTSGRTPQTGQKRQKIENAEKALTKPRAVAPDLGKHRENGHESHSAGQGNASAKRQETGNQNASPGRNPQSHETDDELPTPHQRRDKT